MRHEVAVQIIEPDRVDEEKIELAPNGNQIRMGVELDSRTKRPVAYHVLTYHKGDYDYMLPANQRKYDVIPAEEMMHIFRPERAGQTRGVPWSSAAITSLKMLHGYREAELIFVNNWNKV